MEAFKIILNLFIYAAFVSLLPLKATSTSRTQAEGLIRWKDTLSSSPSLMNNVLLEFDMVPRLSDFGIAKLLTRVTGQALLDPHGTRTCTHNEGYREKFGVVTFEIMMGRHPGKFLTSLQSSNPTSTAQDGLVLLLKDILDQRLLPPTNKEAEQMTCVLNVALACTHVSPESRPSMRTVAQELSVST